jgi:hypothetical protein
MSVGWPATQGKPERLAILGLDVYEEETELFFEDFSLQVGRLLRAACGTISGTLSESALYFERRDPGN